MHPLLIKHREIIKNIFKENLNGAIKAVAGKLLPTMKLTEPARQFHSFISVGSHLAHTEILAIQVKGP